MKANNESKSKCIYRQLDVIKRISDETGYTEESVKEIVQAMETVISDMMLEPSPNKNVLIYPFTGIRIKSEYHGLRTHSHPLNPDGCLIPEGIKLSAGVTKNYKSKKAAEYRLMHDSYLVWKERAMELGYSTELKELKE